MTTTPIADRIAERRAALTKQRDERLDPLDYPRTWTQRQVNVYDAETVALDRMIAAFNTAIATWAALPSLDADEKWRDFLQSSRDGLNTELLAIRAPIRDDATRERARALGWSIELIDHGWAANRLPATIVSLASSRIGQLMREAGYVTDGPELRGPNGFRGSLADTEQRLTDLTAQRAAAEAALDGLLLSDEERAQRDAEDQAFRAAIDSLELRGGGETFAAYHKVTGERLTVADMTPAQAAAFERMAAIERAYHASVLARQPKRASATG